MSSQNDVAIEGMGVSLARPWAVGSYNTQVLVFNSLGRDRRLYPSPSRFETSLGSIVIEGATVEIVNAAVPQDANTFKDASPENDLPPENQVLLLEGFRVDYAARTFEVRTYTTSATLTVTVGMPGEYTPLSLAVNAQVQAGTTLTVTTAAEHYLAVGDQVLVLGVPIDYSNAGFYAVTSVPTATTFTVTLPVAAATSATAIAGGAYAYVQRWATPEAFSARVALAMNNASIAAGSVNRYDVTYSSVTQAYQIRRTTGTYAFDLYFPVEGGVGSMLGFDIGKLIQYVSPGVRDNILVQGGLTLDQIFAQDTVRFYSSKTPYTDFFRGLPTVETMQTLGADLTTFGNSAALPVPVGFVFIDHLGVERVVTLESGYYTYTTLASVLEANIATAVGATGVYSVTYDANSGYTISTTYPEMTVVFTQGLGGNTTSVLLVTYLRFYPQSITGQTIVSNYSRPRHDQWQRYGYVSDTVTDLLTITRAPFGVGKLNALFVPTYVGTTLTLETDQEHGLQAGSIMYFMGNASTTAATTPPLFYPTEPLPGYFYVTSTPAPLRFTIEVASYAAGVIDDVSTNKITQPYGFYADRALFPQGAMAKIGYHNSMFGQDVYVGDQATLNGGRLFYIRLETAGGMSTAAATGARQEQGNQPYIQHIETFSFHGFVDGGSQTTVYGDAQITRGGLPWIIAFYDARGRLYRTYGQDVYGAIRITPNNAPTSSNVRLIGYRR